MIFSFSHILNLLWSIEHTWVSLYDCHSCWVPHVLSQYNGWRARVQGARPMVCGKSLQGYPILVKFVGRRHACWRSLTQCLTVSESKIGKPIVLWISCMSCLNNFYCHVCGKSLVISDLSWNRLICYSCKDVKCHSLFGWSLHISLGSFGINYPYLGRGGHISRDIIPYLGIRVWVLLTE